MKTSINIFWFRRDLRLNDNCGLYHALTSDKNVLPIFIFDEDIINKLPKDDSRVNFLHQELENMHKQLLEINSGISIFHGKPLDIFNELSIKYHIEMHTFWPQGITYHKRLIKNTYIVAPRYKIPCKNTYILAPSYEKPQ